MMNAKYTEGCFVRCISRTEENHEGLILDKVYTLKGESIHDGFLIYAVQDESGNLFYSIDRFEKVDAPVKIQTASMYGEFTPIESLKQEMVNHPSHYTDGGIETIDYLEAKLGEAGFIGFLQGNVLKYMSRVGKKHDEIEDLKKARWYLDKLITTMGSEVPVDAPVDAPVRNPITKKQIQYIAGLTTSLGYDRANLPSWLSPLQNYKELTEAEAITLIDRLLTIKNHLEK